MRIDDVPAEILIQQPNMVSPNSQRAANAAFAGLKFANWLALFFFFAFVLAAAIYIATIGAPGIYYDYQLIPTFHLIHELINGNITVNQYLSELQTFRPHVQFFYTPGRFQPLYQTDYELLMTLTNSVALLWLYQSILFTVACLALFKVTSELCGSKPLAAIAIVLLLFPQAGFAYTWTTLASTSVGQPSVAIIISLLFYFSFLRGANGVALLASMIFTAIALCYNEVTFPAIGAFAGLHLLMSLRLSVRRERIASLCLIIVLAGLTIWAAFDILLPYVHDTGGSYIGAYLHGSGSKYGFSLLLANLRIYIATDPVLVFLAAPLFCLQAFWFLSGRQFDRRQRLITAALGGASAWLITLLILGIANEHFQYLAVPAYFFAIPGIAAKAADGIAGISAVRWSAKFESGLNIVFLALSLAPFGLPGQPTALKFAIDNRFDFQNWKKTIDKSYAIIRNDEPQKTIFYFYKSPRASTIELYMSFTAQLVARGLLPKDFDLTYASPKDIAWVGFKKGDEYASSNTLWSWPRNGRARPPQSGDYMIVNSWWPLTSRQTIDAVLTNYDLVYGTTGLYGCEPFRFGSAFKYILNRVTDEISDMWPSWNDKNFAGSTSPLKQACSPLTDRRNFYIFQKR